MTTIAVIPLLLLSAACNAPTVATTTTTTTTTTPGRNQETTAKRRVFGLERFERSHKPSWQQRQQPHQPLQQQTDRRVIPWVSIAILLNILFFFRSIAAPFFDPLVSPRRASRSFFVCDYLNCALIMSTGRAPSSHRFLCIFLPACIPIRLVGISNYLNCAPPSECDIVFACHFFLCHLPHIETYLVATDDPTCD